MKYKALTSHEAIAVQAIVDGYSRADAYKKAFKNAERWRPTILKLKIRAFFCAERIKYYIDVLASGIAEELPEKITKEQAFNNASKLAGRPTCYYHGLVDELIAFFNIAPYESIEYENKKTGETAFATKINPLPTKSGFAAKVGVCSDTLNEWARAVDQDGNFIHPEFATAYKLADDYQQHLLVTNTLMGEYQSSFAIFLAKNLLGWRDSKDLTISSAPDKPLEKVTKEMSSEQAALIYKESSEQD